jgi:hypothetical protein
VPKKPYEAPRLEIYGSLREITGSTSMMGMRDGAAHGMTKTG